jgi:hypothetical protein
VDEAVGRSRSSSSKVLPTVGSLDSPLFCYAALQLQKEPSGSPPIRLGLPLIHGEVADSAVGRRLREGFFVEELI